MRTAGHRKLRLGERGKSLIKASRRFVEDDMMTYAAAIAYHLFFSLFSFLISLIALLGILRIPGFFDRLVEEAQTVLPEQAMRIVEQVVGQIREQPSEGVLFFGIVAALWSASAGVRALMHALNAAYHVEQERQARKRYPLSIFYTIFLAVMVIVAVGLTLLSSQEMRLIADQIGVSVGTIFLALWTWLRFPVAVLLLMVVVAFVYYMLPNADEPFRLITPGAVLAVIVWVAASLGFSYYVSNFVVYNATYGSLGAILILLLYFFISASVLLFGAEVNVEIYHQLIEDEEEGEKTPEAGQSDE